MAARILLVVPGDHTHTGHILRDHLLGLDIAESVLTASDENSAIKLLRNSRVNILVTDTNFADNGYPDLIRFISDDYPHIRILALAADSRRDSIFRAFNAGAAGYLLRERFETEIGPALRTVMNGVIYISPGIARGVSPEAFLQRLRQAHFSQLFAKREHEVLECMRERMTNREISEKLHISVSTVKSHKQNIMDKLGIRKSADIAKYLTVNDLF